MYIAKSEEGTAQILTDRIADVNKEWENEITTKENYLDRIDPIEDLGNRNNLQLVYASMVITIYSFLESRLYLACKLIEHKNPVKIGDIRGEGVNKYKTFLTKAHGVKFEIVNQSWSSILRYAELRNTLIHDNVIGLHVSEKKKVQKLESIRHLTSKEISGRLTYTIENTKLHYDFLESIQEFLKHVYYVEQNFSKDSD